jgi:hypothetical protein
MEQQQKEKMLIICEKPSIWQNMLSEVSVFKNKILKNYDVTIEYIYKLRSYETNKIKDILKNKDKMDNLFNNSNVIDGVLKIEKEELKLSNDMCIDFNSFDKILLFIEYKDHSELGFMLEFLEENKIKEDKFITICSSSKYNYRFTDDLIIEMLNKEENEVVELNQSLKEYMKQYKIKRYYDLNYNLNAERILRPLFNKYNLNKNIPITKNLILLLQVLNDKKIKMNEKNLYNEFEIQEFMDKYVGSKKYVDIEKEFGSIFFGDLMTRCTLIKNMFFLGIFDIYQVNNKAEIQLKYDFFEMLNMFHKNTYDKDINARIRADWFNLSYNEAKEKMDRSLEFVFKAQSKKISLELGNS